MADKPALSSKSCPPSPESLSKKVVRGGMGVFALRITSRSLGFIRTIILARLESFEKLNRFRIMTFL